MEPMAAAYLIFWLTATGAPAVTPMSSLTHCQTQATMIWAAQNSSTPPPAKGMVLTPGSLAESRIYCVTTK